MAFYEKKLSRQDIYDGYIIHVHKDEVELPDGNTSFREIVDHHGGVCIVAVDSDGGVFVVRQFRYAYGREITEIPAGKLEAGEDPLDCAGRELSEETGCTAEKIESLGVIYPTPGYASEVIHIYLATGLKRGESHLDEDEFLEAKKIPFKDLERMVLTGEVNDAKTVVGVMRAKYVLGL